jgi:DNA-binding GntR family transcriptional regulator
MTKATTPRPLAATRTRGPIERPPSLVDEITARIQSDILDGRLAPGQRISAAAVSRELGVSHIPVREALRRLEAGALVESTHHQGAAVSRISIGELHDIYDLRRLIEGTAARSAASLYTAADLETIVRAGERLMSADPTDPASIFWEAHRALHRAILAPALNPTVSRVLSALWQSAERYAHLRTLVFGSPARAVGDHPHLISVVMQRDPDLLAQELVAHLSMTEQMVTDGFRRVNPERRPDQVVEFDLGPGA